MMCKILFLQYIYNLSDDNIMGEASLNLAYLYFLGLNPEDKLPEKSLLSKFRTLRLGESTLDEIIIGIVRQCVDKGIIKGNSVSIDATHIEANTIKKKPERIMKHLGKAIAHTYEQEAGTDLEGLPAADYKEIPDHKEAKAVMKGYLDTVLDKVEPKVSTKEVHTAVIIQNARNILADPKFMNQKGLRSLVDGEGRVGRKSKTQDFFGYKTEFVMTTDERIITSVRTGNGAYIDGSHAKVLFKDKEKWSKTPRSLWR
jgi:hypothetical protein